MVVSEGHWMVQLAIVVAAARWPSQPTRQMSAKHSEVIVAGALGVGNVGVTVEFLEEDSNVP